MPNAVNEHIVNLEIGDPDGTRNLSLEAAGATITVAAESGNNVDVTVQLTDAEGNNLAHSAVIDIFLSDAATGLDVTSAGVDGGISVPATGSLIATLSTGIASKIQTDATGQAIIRTTDATATGTWYMVVQLPSGKQVVSGAIAHT